MQRTLSIIKPDAVEDGCIGGIYGIYEKNGLRVVAAKMMVISQAQGETLYAEHSGKAFYPVLLEFIVSGPSMVQVLEGEDAVALHRRLMGATNPADAEAGTIRGLYARGRGDTMHRNAVHGSDSPESAEQEIKLFFTRDEVYPVGGLRKIMSGVISGSCESRLVNVLDYDRFMLRQFFAGIGEKEFHADQVIRGVHRQGVDLFSDMTNIGRGLREQLRRVAVVAAPQIYHESGSVDGVRKWLLRLEDGQCVETVFIPEKNRGTLCVSSQLGCALACSFCATGAAGFGRNLRTAEIIGQMWQAKRILAASGASEISNVVFMGMGEPLLNLEQVLPAVELMRDEHAYGLSWRRVTISTVGVVPGIDALRAHTPLALAVSLHAAEDTLRDKLIPLNRTWPLAELMAACERFSRANKDQAVTFEYTMLAGVNDCIAAARKLTKLLSRMPAKVNLIPCNPFPGSDFAPSSPQVIAEFQQILMRSGIVTTVRRTRGGDVNAACGQLAGSFVAKSRRHREYTVSCELAQ